MPEVWVDAASAGPGAGTREDPCPVLGSALKGYSLSLQPDSPCRGSGLDGTDMGAASETCGSPGSPALLVHLAPGAYAIEGFLEFPVSILGAGEEATTIEGTVIGLRTGSVLEGVTVRGGKQGGIRVLWGEAPVIRHCRISGNSDSHGGGVFCSSNSSPTITSCTISGNLAIERGGGVYCDGKSSPTITNCTIAGNKDSGVYCSSSSSPTLTSCIVWGNVGGGISRYSREEPDVTFSCIQGTVVWPGTGNIASDPRFCGWEDRLEVFVDSGSPGPGDGSRERPYAGLADALLLSYSYSLRKDSPCLGTGPEGVNMGADLGTCDASGEGIRTVHIASGTYACPGSITERVILEGAGADATVIEGLTFYLRSGSRLSGLTLAGRSGMALRIAGGEAPEIEGCRIRDVAAESAIHCEPLSAPIFRDCAFTGNKVTTVILCDEGSSASFLDCAVSENDGTGILCLGSSPALTSCTISGNSGGGIACSGSASPVLRGCRILANRTAGAGAGLSSTDGASPLLEDCLFAYNEADRSGGGIYAWESSPSLLHCTVVENRAGLYGSGIHSVDSRLTVESTILWQNPGEGFRARGVPDPRMSFSLIEGDAPWPGEGNLVGDPLFCGWGERREVHADAAAPGPGDGSAESPYPSLGPALEYSFALASASPCLGKGKDGTNMGADFGTCAEEGVPERLVRLAPGTYEISGSSLIMGASLAGSGTEETIIEGTVIGLRTGRRISSLTVKGGSSGGIVVDREESPEILEVLVEGSGGAGIVCRAGSAPRIGDSRISGNMEGLIIEERSAPILENCIFEGNSIAWCGEWPKEWPCSDVRCGPGSSPRFLGCRFADTQGPGISAEAGASLDLEGCAIGGIGGSFFSAAIVNSTIARGIAVADSSLVLESSLLAGAQDRAIDAENSRLRLVNCTVAGNAGGLHVRGRTPSLEVVNSIVWGNGGEGIVWGIVGEGFERPEISYSSIEGGWEGEGNVAVDPLFVHPPYDFHLRPESPLIDAGRSGAIAALLDLDGRSRICGPAVDLGAYEAGPSDCPPVPPLAARFTLSAESGEEPLEVEADGSASIVEGLEGVTFDWDFGDGEAVPGVEARHTYTSPGRFAVTLRITDRFGRKASSSRAVTVHLRSGDTSPWIPSEIGAPAFPGGAREEAGCLLAAAGGSLGSPGSASDACLFVQRELAGYFTLTARIAEEAGGERGSLAGLMVREGLGAGARQATVALRSGIEGFLEVCTIRREAENGPSGTLLSALAIVPEWLRLERRGDRVLGSTSADGATWTGAFQVTLPGLPEKVLAGLVLSGNDPGQGPFRALAARACLEVLGGEGEPGFIRGDVSPDGSLDLSDAIAVLSLLFLGPPAALGCEDGADADDSGTLGLTDGILILEFLFLGGPPPAEPFPACGLDPTPSALACESHGACE
jgi:parallel beta-helix repeat protein